MAAKVRTAGGGEEFKKPHKMLLRAAMMMIGRKVFELLPPSKCRRSGGGEEEEKGMERMERKTFQAVCCVCVFVFTVYGCSRRCLLRVFPREVSLEAIPNRLISTSAV